jgi:hypothetical protein
VRLRLTDALTSLAARAFPPSRRADSRVVRDCARDAIDGTGPRAVLRESLSVAGAGLRVRLAMDARDVRHAPWRPALAALTLPLAAALLCVWTFGFVPRYDHWPLGEGWVLLLGGSLVAVIGAALEARWPIALGAAAVFVAAGAPYVGYGTEVALADTPSFFYASGVDLGAASLLCLPPGRSTRPMRTALTESSSSVWTDPSTRRSSPTRARPMRQSIVAWRSSVAETSTCSTRAAMCGA